MKYRLDRVTAGNVCWQMIADTKVPTVWVLEGDTVYEFANRHDAVAHVVAEYRRVADLRSMQPGQAYTITMNDGTSKTVQVQSQTPDGVQVIDQASGQAMTIPHVQPGAEPKPAQQGGTGGATPKPNATPQNQSQSQPATPVSPENRTYSLCQSDLKVTASEFGKTPYYCKHDQGYLYPKNPSDREKYCAQCGMVYVADKRKGFTPGPPTVGNFYFCSRCNTARTALLDRDGEEVHRALPNGRVVRYLSCQHPTPIEDAPVKPTWQPRRSKTAGCDSDYWVEGDSCDCPAHKGKKTAVITGGPGSYHVKSEEGKNLGGPYKSREQAEHRLKQVEYFKHKKSKIISEENECVNCGKSGRTLNERGECGQCARRKAFQAWKNRERIVHAFDIIAQPPMPQNQGMPSGDAINEGDTINRDEKSPGEFAEEPESQPNTQDPNAKRKLTPHEIIEEAESLIRNALVKGVKIGASELTEYMSTYYQNNPQELMQGIALAWQKVQYEEQMEGGEDVGAPGGEGFGPQAPTTPEEAAQMAPRNGPIRTKSL